MDVKSQIQTLIKEAQIYKAQGLLEQSKTRYIEALEMIQGHKQFGKSQKLISAVKSQISSVEEDIAELEEAPEKPVLSEATQALIGDLFSFSRNRSIAEIEAAVALAKFGQYEKAVGEFKRLIKENKMPLLAAKNLLRCHLELATREAAIDQLKSWASRRKPFSKSELNYLKNFLQGALGGGPRQPDATPIDVAGNEEGDVAGRVDETTEIYKVSIPMTMAPFNGQNIDFEVTYQTGNRISTVIPADRKDLINALSKGLRFSAAKCFSSFGMLSAGASVTEIKPITSGPRRGDYSLDLEIEQA
jgi:tetratricopeptide (TPR) repeat protein